MRGLGGSHFELVEVIHFNEKVRIVKSQNVVYEIQDTTHEMAQVGQFGCYLASLTVFAFLVLQMAGHV